MHSHSTDRAALSLLLLTLFLGYPIHTDSLAQTRFDLSSIADSFSRSRLISPATAATGFEAVASLRGLVGPLSNSESRQQLSFSTPGLDDWRGSTGTPVQFRLGNSSSSERLVFSSAVLVLSNLAIYHQFNGAWWRQARTGFHFYKGYHRTRGSYDFALSDSYYYHLDKAGHFFSSMVMTESLHSLYRWVGFSGKGASRMAAVVASILMLEIEIYDGFFAEWGFSAADFTANELGVMWALAQRRSSALRDIRVKISYDPFALLEQEHWIKNYGAMTFWLSLPVHRWLPGRLQLLWPRWLDLAFGYGTDRLRHGRLEAYVALDVNAAELIRSESVYLRPLRTLLTYLHLPLPAIQLRPSLRIRPYHL